MESLGYASSAPGPTSKVLADPKSRLENLSTLREGMRLLSTRQEEAGVRVLRRLVDSDPDFLDAWQFLGVGLHRLGRNMEALYLRGSIRMELDDPSGAEVDLRRVLEIDPNRADAALKLAVLLTESGRVDEVVLVLGRRRRGF